MNDNPTIVDWEIEATCDLAVQLVPGCLRAHQMGSRLFCWPSRWELGLQQLFRLESNECSISVLAFHQQIERRDPQSNIGPEVPGVEGHLGAIFSR